MHTSVPGTSLDDCCLFMQVNGTISIHYAPSPTNGTNKQMPTDVDGLVHCSVQLTKKFISFIFGRQNYKEELKVRTKQPLKSSVATTFSLFYCCFVIEIIYNFFTRIL
jgi:hypothetical protein